MCRLSNGPLSRPARWRFFWNTVAAMEAWLDATMEHWSSVVSAQELAYGWAFRWNSDRYLETLDVMYALGGNGPLIVLRATGELHALGTALPFDQLCANFERNVLG